MRRGTRAEWAARVGRWRASGLTGRAFAARERVNRRTLSFWAWKLGSEHRAPAAFIEVEPPSSRHDQGCIEIVVRDSLRIRVSGEFDPAVLRRIVAALEAP